MVSEGNTSLDFWKWNQTIGSLLKRPGRLGSWGYFNTNRLGLIEYLYVDALIVVSRLGSGAYTYCVVWTLLGWLSHI